MDVVGDDFFAEDFVELRKIFFFIFEIFFDFSVAVERDVRLLEIIPKGVVLVV